MGGGDKSNTESRMNEIFFLFSPKIGQKQRSSNSAKVTQLLHGLSAMYKFETDLGRFVQSDTSQYKVNEKNSFIFYHFMFLSSYFRFA